MPSDAHAPSDLLGLTPAAFLPLLERIAGRAFVSVSVTELLPIQGHPGAQGQKVVPVFLCVDAKGQAWEQTLFLKKPDAATCLETEQYLQIQKCGAPVPAYHGTFRNAAGEEVLAVEYLDRIHSDEEIYGNADLFRQFIVLAARLNALPVDPSYAQLHHHGAVHPIPLTQIPVVTEIVKCVADGAFGERLQNWLTETGACARTFTSRLEQLSQVVAELPMGFVHGDFWPRHVGGRGGSAEMLAIDLGYSLYATRFFDIASFAGPADDLPKLPLTREETARVYLEEYTQQTGTRLTRPAFLHEVNAVWLAWNVRRLGELLKPARQGCESSRRQMRHLLLRLFSWQEDQQAPEQ